MTLRLIDLSVRFGEAPGLEPVSLEVAAGERVALVGMSGAGKTSLLRAVAGLAPAAGGRVEIGGRDVTRLPPERRDAVLLHQTPLLFPHLDVRENVGFALRVRGVADREVRQRVDELLEAVRLEGFAGRLPRTLSGGQRHRVALARAVAARPAVLLLDEPLSSLDPALRDEVRAALDDLLRRHRTALVLVTHDLDEAATLADRIGVLIDRRLAQLDAPGDLFARPRTRAVARLLGIPNQLPARVLPDGSVESPLGRLDLPGVPPSAGPATLVFRADALVPDPAGTVHGMVVGVRHRAQRPVAIVRVGAVEVEAAPGDEPIPAGAPIRLRVRPELLLIYPAEVG